MTGLAAITVPQWGLTMEEGTVAQWHRAVGDPVAPGDAVCDVETSKIANVVEAQATGTLVRIVADEGATLPVGGLLAVLADGPADDAAIDAFVSDFQANFTPVEAGEASANEPLTVDVGGRTISYRHAAPADGAGALPVVLLHGFGGDKDNWLFNISAIAADRPVYAPDLPGHGASSKDVGDGTLDDLARAVAGFMVALGLQRAHLVGHSMGAAVALTLAGQDTGRVASLALIAPAGLGETINGDYIAGFVAADRRKAMKPVLQMLFADAGLVTRDMVNDVLKYKRLDGVDTALKAIAQAVFPGGRQAAGFRDALPGLDMPVLALWGADDAIANAGDADGLNGAEVLLLPGIGHMPHMEAAGEVNARLAAHLASADG